jgi:uncharacterized protein with ParB-like and HNH nuclease domain
MGTINFDTSNKTFREILGNGLKYEVPRFQRDYAWTEEQWSDLWQDIEEVIQEQDDEHYMGYLVLQRINDNTSIIIDGQQRLTTVTLIIIAALYQLKELVENNDHPEDNQRRLEALQRSYIGALNPVSLTVENKLQLNRNNQSYFKTYLASLQKPRVSRIKRSEKQLADACRFFQDKLKAVKWSGDKIAGFIEAMASRLLFTTIRVGSEVNAYRVFETLNARGVQLSTPDLLKNFIFSAIDQNHSAHETLITEIEDQWSRVLDQLGKSDFSHFLLTEWNRRNPLARKNDLFKRIKRSITTQEDAFAQLRNLDQAAEIYTAIQDADDEFWKAHKLPDALPSLQALNLFNISQPVGIFISAWEKWSRQDFLTLLRIVEIISLRYNVICQNGASEQEGIYNQVARAIYDGKSLVEVLPDLRRIYPKDNEFKHSFAMRSFKTRNISKKARYLLARIERHLSPENVLDESLLTLEHILPEHPNEEWCHDFGDEGIEDWAERLGNMTLMTGSANKDIDQQPFPTKKNWLAGSPYLISRKASEYQEWNKAAIESRQRWLADQACAIWRVSQFS